MNTYAMNLCDVFPAVQRCGALEMMCSEMEQKYGNRLTTIYIGSYFCSQMFLKLTDLVSEETMAFCTRNGISVNLTVPIFSQKDLENGKAAIRKLLTTGNNPITEITVNDIAMMHYVHETFPELNLFAGRLFQRTLRDMRYPDEKPQSACLSDLIQPDILQRIEAGILQGVEFDGIAAHIKDDIQKQKLILVDHEPYSYMTTGNICEYASIRQPVEKKFRPNTICGMECQEIYIQYRINPNLSMIKIGRAVYFETAGVNLDGDTYVRHLLFPLEHVAKLLHQQ